MSRQTNMPVHDPIVYKLAMLIPEYSIRNIMPILATIKIAHVPFDSLTKHLHILAVNHPDKADRIKEIIPEIEAWGKANHMLVNMKQTNDPRDLKDMISND